MQATHKIISYQIKLFIYIEQPRITYLPQDAHDLLQSYVTTTYSLCPQTLKSDNINSCPPKIPLSSLTARLSRTDNPLLLSKNWFNFFGNKGMILSRVLNNQHQQVPSKYIYIKLQLATRASAGMRLVHTYLKYVQVCPQTFGHMVYLNVNFGNTFVCLHSHLIIKKETKTVGETVEIILEKYCKKNKQGQTKRSHSNWQLFSTNSPADMRT